MKINDWLYKQGGRGMNKIVRFFVYWVWQFPQMALGAILVKILGASKQGIITKDGRIIIYWYFERNNWFSKFISGVSLAVFILLSDNNDNETVEHEHGHSMQSLYLGWLYLPVIGIYSAVFCNLWDRLFHKDWNGYDRRYWYYKTRWSEKWADELGGVDRNGVLARMHRPENAKWGGAA